MIRRWTKRLAIAGLVVFGAIQLIPYGRAHTNPPVTAEPNWNNRRTRALVEVACYSCHSNETEWPWYSNIAPMSWLLQRDVDGGREVLNFSEWDREQEGDEAAETVEDGEMPPLTYLLTHPEARLSDPEKAALVRGLEISLEGGSDNSGPGSGDEDDSDNSGPGSDNSGPGSEGD